MSDAMTPDTALCTYVVHQWNCDHFGHLNVRHYAAAFDDAIFIFWGVIGNRPAEGGPFPVSAEVKIGFRHEALAGTIATISASVTKVGTKSVGLRFDMVDRGDGRLLALCDVVEVFIDPATRESCAIPAVLREALTQDRCPGRLHPLV